MIDHQVKWISEDRFQNLNEDALLKLHFPAIPFFTIGCYDNYWSPTVSPAQEVESFRTKNPDVPPDISDDEILKRYLPAPFPRSVGSTFLRLCWIPESGDIIQPSDQMQLLDRIWDGVQTHVVDGTNFENDGLFCEYAYWIDFENKIMEIKGVIKGVLTLPFKELKVGLFERAQCRVLERCRGGRSVGEAGDLMSWQADWTEVSWFLSETLDSADTSDLRGAIPLAGTM